MPRPDQATAELVRDELDKIDDLDTLADIAHALEDPSVTDSEIEEKIRDQGLAGITEEELRLELQHQLSGRIEQRLQENQRTPGSLGGDSLVELHRQVEHMANCFELDTDQIDGYGTVDQMHSEQRARQQREEQGTAALMRAVDLVGRGRASDELTEAIQEAVSLGRRPEAEMIIVDAITGTRNTDTSSNTPDKVIRKAVAGLDASSDIEQIGALAVAQYLEQHGRGGIKHHTSELCDHLKALGFPEREQQKPVVTAGISEFLDRERGRNRAATGLHPSEVYDRVSEVVDRFDVDRSGFETELDSYQQTLRTERDELVRSELQGITGWNDLEAVVRDRSTINAAVAQAGLPGMDDAEFQALVKEDLLRRGQESAVVNATDRFDLELDANRLSHVAEVAGLDSDAQVQTAATSLSNQAGAIRTVELRAPQRRLNSILATPGMSIEDKVELLESTSRQELTDAYNLSASDWAQMEKAALESMVHAGLARLAPGESAAELAQDVTFLRERFRIAADDPQYATVQRMWDVRLKKEVDIALIEGIDVAEGVTALQNLANANVFGCDDAAMQQAISDVLLARYRTENIFAGSTPQDLERLNARRADAAAYLEAFGADVTQTTSNPVLVDIDTRVGEIEERMRQAVLNVIETRLARGTNVIADDLSFIVEKRDELGISQDAVTETVISGIQTRFDAAATSGDPAKPGSAAVLTSQERVELAGALRAVIDPGAVDLDDADPRIVAMQDQIFAPAEVSAADQGTVDQIRERLENFADPNYGSLVTQAAGLAAGLSQPQNYRDLLVATAAELQRKVNTGEVAPEVLEELKEKGGINADPHMQRHLELMIVGGA